MPEEAELEIPTDLPQVWFELVIFNVLTDKAFKVQADVLLPFIVVEALALNWLTWHPDDIVMVA